MDSEGGRFFEQSLRDSRFYLEFGSGGSTVLAARLGKQGVSIEGDGYYCRDVRRKLRGVSHDMQLFHVNIGRTGEWGYPLDQRPTDSNVAAWRRYVGKPFDKLGDGFYDLVLVDGRFRVACALQTIAEAKKRKASLRLLVDDYHDAEEPRPHYYAIEKYARMTGTAGRIAIFDIEAGDLIAVPDEAAIGAAVRDCR